MPFSHPGPLQRLFTSSRLFGIACSTLSLVGYFLTKLLLRHATPARRVTFISAAVTSFRSPEFLCIQDFLKKSKGSDRSQSEDYPLCRTQA
jgi:hypothetical protein